MPIQEVYRLNMEDAALLAPVSSAQTQTFTPNIVTPSGIYGYNGSRYDLTSSGYYIFWSPFSDTTRRFVFCGDPVSALSAAAWWVCHGTADARVSGESQAAFFDRLSAKARTSQLNLQCAETHQWVASRLLNPCGIGNRTVRFITLESENGHDDSHVCLEASLPSGWALVDISGNRLFADAATGLRLSARDIPSKMVAGGWLAELLASDASAAANPAVPGKYDTTMWALTRFSNETAAREWYRRVCQAVGIDRLDADGIVRCYWRLPAAQQSRKAWLEAYAQNWRVLDPSVWDAMFYP